LITQNYLKPVFDNYYLNYMFKSFELTWNYTIYVIVSN